MNTYIRRYKASVSPRERGGKLQTMYNVEKRIEYNGIEILIRTEYLEKVVRLKIFDTQGFMPFIQTFMSFIS
jgi:hypothetical protein